MISNRGVKVWPNGHDETFCTDHWRCRFQPSNGGVITHDDINRLMQAITIEKIDFIKTEHLCNFNGKAGYSLSQGQ
jgi:isocitrate dehydrogenase